MADQDSPLPYIPPWSQLKVFLLGLVWASVSALAPAAMLVADSLIRYSDYKQPVDWPQVQHLAVSGAFLGVGAYWRKHKALLQEPPKP